MDLSFNFSIFILEKLRNGDYRKDSELQKRSNLGLKLSKGSYILIGAFLFLYCPHKLLEE